MGKPNTDNEQQLLDKLANDGIKIPPQPAVLIELEKQLGKNDVNIADIAALVGKDVGLSAIVFKLLNSPVYGLRRPVESLEKAISVLGMTQMSNIVKSAALRQALGGQEKYFEIFWEHSTDIAQLSSVIAWKLRTVCNIYPDQAYLAGLFLDCGVPILMQRFPDYCKSFRTAGNKPCWPNLNDEDLRFSTDHCVTGYLIARHWRLPDFICQTVRFHHEILSTEHKATTMVAIVQMAMHIHNIYSGNADDDWEKDRPRVLEELGLSVEGLKEFEEEIYDASKES